MQQPHSPKTAPVTDSPWYWVLIFALAALVGIFTIGPKFERRQEIVETKFHARERAQKREPLERPPGQEGAETDRPWSRIFTLGPLVVVIIAIALVALTRVFKLQRQRIADLRKPSETPSPPP